MFWLRNKKDIFSVHTLNLSLVSQDFSLECVAENNILNSQPKHNNFVGTQKNSLDETVLLNN